MDLQNNPKLYSKLLCPVPEEQRPLNEYLKLLQSSFYKRPFLNLFDFIKYLLKVWLVGFLIFLPITNSTIKIEQYPIKFFIINSILSIFTLILIVLRLTLGWQYICDRLYQPTLFYEESGWYDGRLWIKPKSILVQDRLICKYQVIPVIKNLNYILLSLTLTILVFFLLYLLN